MCLRLKPLARQRSMLAVDKIASRPSLLIGATCSPTDGSPAVAVDADLADVVVVVVVGDGGGDIADGDDDEACEDDQGDGQGESWRRSYK